ncbi:uncharacterized protein EAF01_005500 [Botrytis porri]|uniref:Uncharacterized protein n=1 Tax=Botrytis porri TaxID=87229 RepID=A0A4Z1KML4_9HELO|nr:uncharacterized protein EAF01_005500 [Botrytis porri]KAF7904978.1 hypothetical protein EAF01_005500 [Botrytis porri]TGO84844.1 hypothetical protein BPOR_0459g00100 [Botrytis porri]
MARQPNHQKVIPDTHRKPLDRSKAQGAKSKPKTSKVSKNTSSPKQSREQAKKFIVVKPIPKNEVRKLQQSGKDTRSPQAPKHTHGVEVEGESFLQPEDLSSAFEESLEEARTHILRIGKSAFEEAHSTLLQKLTQEKSTDQSFLQAISHNAHALSVPLATQKIQMTVQQKGRRISEIVEIGKRIEQFRQTIEEEENKLDGYWKEWEGLQMEFKMCATRVFGGEMFDEEDAEEGYHVDMLLLDKEYMAQINGLVEEVEEVGNDAVRKMKASEKEIDVKTDKVRQRIVGAMMW